MGNARIPALVVGTGFGCHVHVPALRAAGFEVVGLVGTNVERLARRAAESGVAAHFTDLEQAIERTAAKAVTVATTPATHARIVLKAIARGCHVVCEKPFAIDAAEGQTLLSAAEQAGIVHMVAHEFRWMPERALFGRAIADGMIGEPRFLVVDQFIPFCADPQTPHPAWWFDQAAGGGWLGAGGSHLIDQIRVWLGEFHSLSACLMVVSDRSDEAEDSYSLRFRSDSGVEGSMQQSAAAWGATATMWRCAGSKGTVWIENGTVVVADRSGVRALPTPPDLELPTVSAESDFDLSRKPPHFGTAPFIRLCEAFRDKIEGVPDRAPVPVPTFQDGLASMRILDAIRASSVQGGALQLL
jgi:predicted dehydrogenase